MLNKSKIKNIIIEQEFYPTWIGMFTNPFYFARKGLLENIQSIGHNINGKTLDIGCGSKPYEKLFQSSEYIGLEIDTPQNRQGKKADYFYSGEIFPFSDQSFDSVITNQVFEHIFYPELFLSEIHRVLKKDGMFLITVPFVWDEHEQPYDYARYSSFGMNFLLKKQNFEIIEYKKSMNDIRVIFQLTNAYLYKITVTRNRVINLIFSCLLMSPFNIIGEILSKTLPRNDDLYLDNIILARKKDQNE